MYSTLNRELNFFQKKTGEIVSFFKGITTFAHVFNDSVAQLVEQMTLNHWVDGSSPSGVTKDTKVKA